MFQKQTIVRAELCHEEQRAITDVWSADGEVAVDSHHCQQANTGHAKEDVKSCINLQTHKQM